MYSARYVGRFHQVLTPGCLGSRPSMLAVCAGQVQITGTSHASIQCYEEITTLADGRSAALCENTCEGAECEEVFVSTEYLGGKNRGASFGQVLFTCSGSSINDVDAAFIVPASRASECDGTDFVPVSFHVVQLGVVCPTKEGEIYVIDDQYSECGFDNLSQIYGTGHYSCLAGGTCPEETACRIEFDQLVVSADPFYFNECIKSEVETGREALKPLQVFAAPEPPPRDPGQYTAGFQADWSIILDSECTEQLFTRRVNCTNGVIRIIAFAPVDCHYVDGMNGSLVDCTDTNGSEGSIQYVRPFVSHSKKSNPW
jgi:hypothetical protein